jgi:hypothetical protein
MQLIVRLISEHWSDFCGCCGQHGEPGFSLLRAFEIMRSTEDRIDGMGKTTR